MSVRPAAIGLATRTSHTAISFDETVRLWRNYVAPSSWSHATGRTKIVMAGLWTEVCLAFPTLDMLSEGYEVYPVIDAVGGVSVVSHRTAIDRVVQAGARPITSLAFGCELMRNWARPDGDRYRTTINDYSVAGVKWAARPVTCSPEAER